MRTYRDSSVVWDSPLAQRYRLDELLGSSSVAEVYRAEDIRLRRAVAVKLFRPDPAARQRFREEARVLAQWSHPGLMTIFDAGIDGERPYTVMQLVEGESLQCRLRSGPLVPAEVVRLGVRLVGATEHMHGHGIAHQDIKPANVLLDTDGNAYLTDFGVALLAGVAGPTVVSATNDSAAYLAPEQVRGEQVTPAVDVYALGVVLQACMAGAFGDTAIMPAPAGLPRPRASSSVSARLAELLVAMSATDARQRPSLARCLDVLRTLDPTTPAAELPTVVAVPALPPGQRAAAVDLTAAPTDSARRAGRLRTR